jgi:hypothetical protein
MYAQISPLAGQPGQGFGNLAQDLTPRIGHGRIINVQDNFWGGATLIWVRANSVISAQSLVNLVPVFDPDNSFRYDAVGAQITPNSGRPIAVSLGSFGAGQYGWFGLSGIFPVLATAALAAGSVAYLSSTIIGQMGPVSAGRQIISAYVVEQNGRLLVKQGCKAAAGSKILAVPDSEGMFVGMSVTGTGITPGTAIASIDTSNNVILTLDTTTGVSGPVTFTFTTPSGTSVNIVYFNHASTQTQIT